MDFTGMRQVPEEMTDTWPDNDVQSWPDLLGSLTPAAAAAARGGNLVEMQRLKGADVVSARHVSFEISGGPVLGRRNHRFKTRLADQSWNSYLVVFALSALLVASLAVLLDTYLEHGLDPRWHNSEWLTAWLVAATTQAYGGNLCLCAIVLSSDRPRVAMPWAALCILGGTPACILYCCLRQLRHGTLRLAPGRLYTQR